MQYSHSAGRALKRRAFHHEYRRPYGYGEVPAVHVEFSLGAGESASVTTCEQRPLHPDASSVHFNLDSGRCYVAERGLGVQIQSPEACYRLSGYTDLISSTRISHEVCPGGEDSPSEFRQARYFWILPRLCMEVPRNIHA